MMLYERYVEHSNQVAIVPPVGSKYDKEKLKVVIHHQQLDSGIADYERLARTLLELANSIMSCIKMEGYWPTKNSDGRLSILCMKV